MTRTRKYLFRILTVVLLFALIHSVGAKKAAVSGKGSDFQSFPAVESFDERIFVLQSKIVVGALHVLSQAPDKSIPAGDETELSRSIRMTFGQSIGSLSRGSPASLSVAEGGMESLATQPTLLRKHLVLAHYLGFADKKNALCGEVSKLDGGSDDENKLNQIILRICQAESESSTPLLSEQDAVFVEEQLSWTGGLFVYSVLKKTSQETRFFHVIEEAMLSSMKFGAILVLFCGIAVLSILLLAGIVVAFWGGRTSFKFQLAGMPREYCLEIFCLYLAGMFFVPELLKRFTPNASLPQVLGLNIAGILCLVLIVFWPLMFGENIRNIRTSLGIAIEGLKTLLKDMILAPMTYIASLGLLVVLLVLYALLLIHLNVNPAQGAHPIVPIFTETKNFSTILFAGALAVIVAPIVEEIMFRGALYAWLRERFGVFFSILASSVAFAAIHPQGAVGLVPLAFIGAVLAFLREWRGSLVAPIIAHGCFNAGTLALVLVFMR